MLDKYIVKKFTLADCQEHRMMIEAEIILTNTRIERLKATQDKNPDWKHYDKYADDLVDIDSRIEEWEAVLGMLQDDLKLIRKQEEAPVQGKLFDKVEV